MEVKAGYKQTEVGIIPEDWSTPRIETIIDEISMGPFGSDIKVSNFVSTGVPVLNGANVATERLRDAFENFVSFEKAKSLKKAVARRGDIVVTHRGTIGQISYIPDNSAFDRYVVSQSQFRVRFTRQFAIPAWVVLYFHSQQGSKKLLEGKGHTGVPAIAAPTKTFRNLSIPLPPIAEQEAIAEALSDADAFIETLGQLITKKRQVKQGAMQELLTGKRRLPGFTKKWETKRLGDIFEITAGGDFDPTQASDTQDEHFLYPIYSNALTNRGLYGFSSYNNHQAGSITVTARGTLGNANYRDHDFTAIGRVIVLKLTQPLDGRFISEFINNRIDFVIESTGVPQLTAPQISKYEIFFPELPEQTAIAEILSDMDVEIAALEGKLAKARQVKQGMMQELLTGR